MVIILFFFGYQKWRAHEVQRLLSFINNGWLIFSLYPLLGMRGATLSLGVSEWAFGRLLFLGYWNKAPGILGALTSTATLHSYGHHDSLYAPSAGKGPLVGFRP